MINRNMTRGGPEMTRRDAVPSTQVGREQEEYEPPRLTVLGTLAEITLGHPGTQSDGLNPGSTF
jgi:hypothetical protein